MTEEWGPWIGHDGKGCPCVGEYVHVVILSIQGVDPVSGGWSGPYKEINPWEAVGVAEEDAAWRWESGWHPVDRYRIRKPKGMSVLEGILKDVEDEKVEEIVG